MRALLIPLCVVLASATVSSAQLRGQGTYKRLIIPDHIEFIVDGSELLVDTLIMDDHSTLKFTRPFTRLVIRNAVIGKRCKWLGRGMPARNYERQSMDGASLDITITIMKLGQLTIDVSGGLGYKGSPGRPGSPGMNGQTVSNGRPGGSGGPGGPGGNGGNVTFRFRVLGQPIVFTKARKNSVLINVDGGFGGPGGQGGPGGPGGILTGRSYEGVGGRVQEVNGQRGQQGPRGNQGEAGNKGIPGVLSIIPMGGIN